MAGSIKLTREELYEKVWSTPAARLVREFGIPDVALGKICRKLDVPKPYPGYWQAAARGRAACSQGAAADPAGSTRRDLYLRASGRGPLPARRPSGLSVDRTGESAL